MKPFVLSLCIVGIVSAVAFGIYCSNSPEYSVVKIVDGGDTPDATHYAEEFAESLQNSMPLGQPHFYFSDVPYDLKSPDDVFTLNQRALRDYYHEMTLSRPGGESPESVLVIQECDPESGTAHTCRWSLDSKAIFIYGCGKPAGHPHNEKLALVYLVERRTLYSIDISPFLTIRLAREIARQNGNDVRIDGPLDPRIPPPDPNQYKSVQDGRDWRNPYISIQGDGINFLISSSPIVWTLIQADELSKTLTSLPVSAWPYGRVVAVVDGGGPQSGTVESRKRNSAKAQKVLKALGVEINWWPGA